MSLQREGRDILRGKRLYQQLSLSSKERMADALPLLEEIVMEDPFITSPLFFERAAPIAASYRLNPMQRALVQDAFERFSRDRSTVSVYRDLVLSNPDQATVNPIADINNDTQAMQLFLRDIGVVGLGERVNTNNFLLDERIPSCFVVISMGQRHDLLRAFDLPMSFNGSAFIASRIVPGDEEQLSETEAMRLNLLQGKIIVLLDEVDRYRYGSHTRTVRSMKSHELRHYLYGIYHKDSIPTKENWITRRIQDEINAYYGSGEIVQNIDSFLPGEFSVALGGEPVDLSQHPYIVPLLLDVTYELARLGLEDFTNLQAISSIASTSDSLEEVTLRLRMLHGTAQSHPEEILRYLLIFGIEAGTPEQVNTNMLWLHGIIERILALPFTDSEHQSAVMQMALLKTSHVLNTQLLLSYGTTRESIYEQTPFVLSHINSLIDHFSQVPGVSVEPLLLQVQKVEKKLLVEQQRERGEILWEQFLQHLKEMKHPYLQTYNQFLEFHTMGGLVEMREFRKTIMRPLFYEWLQDLGIPFPQIEV